MRVLEGPLRGPGVVARYRAKVLEPRLGLPVVARGSVRPGHDRFYVGTVATGHRPRRLG
jgi:hypothetical protein